MSKSILVVDDDDLIRERICRILEEHGYETLAACDGDEALFQAHMKTPDAIVLDILLPVHDGFDVCTMLQGHKDTRQIPILFVTGVDDPFGRLKGKYFGGMDYLKKPFRNDELIAAVGRVLAATASP